MGASKAEKLALAATVAVELRRADAGVRQRRIKTIGPDGQVVRELPLVEVVERQLLRQGIEIDTKITPGVRPRALRCACGMPYVVPAKGRIPKWCGTCEVDRYRCSAVIDGQRCTESLPRATWTPHNVAARRGKQPICGKCNRRTVSIRLAAGRSQMSADARSDRSRRAAAARSPAAKARIQDNLSRPRSIESESRRRAAIGYAQSFLTLDQCQRRNAHLLRARRAMSPEQEARRIEAARIGRQRQAAEKRAAK